MKQLPSAACRGVFFLCLLLVAGTGFAQVDPALYSGLKWRNVGPFHGGRISAVAGVIGQPGVFYFGAPIGGIWKTTSAGVTWFPVFDSETSANSIGALAVAPTNPNVIYAGTGDPIQGPQGNGVWKSTDAGKTWKHIGLEETVKISGIIVDPKDENLVLVSALGDAKHNGGGVYRSTDGGTSWTRVLQPEGYEGVRDLQSAFDAPGVVLAATQGSGATIGGGGRTGGLQANIKPALLFKSTDEGKTWAEIKIPRYQGRISAAVAMQTNGQRFYIVGNNIENGSGLFRSDDGGATWRHMAGKDLRVSNGQGSYSSGVWVDSQNPDILYTVSTAMYQSRDGGETFEAYKGAPGGEDYHKLWVDPTSGKRMIVGTDQGASVTLDGGKTWSLWYTQPIAQVYHVATDSQYPYHIMAAQQDTGAVLISSRGNWGQVNFTDWSPLPSSEFGIVRADPKDPNIIYGVGYGAGGGGGGLVKIDMRTGQWQNVAPNFGSEASKYTAGRDFQKKFDTAFDPGALYVAYQCLLVTHDAARTWTAASPDLTTPKGAPTVACGQRSTAIDNTPGPRSTPPGVRPPPAPPSISDFSISRVKNGVWWSVSSNGQIYTTADHGKTWTNVTNIAEVPEHTNFHTIEAGDDANTAFVAGRIVGARGEVLPPDLDSNVPLIWRTTDGGKTWTSIVNGLPKDERTGSWVNSIRVDPVQPGLLFAGTETTVYISFDKGDHWQSLRQNLPSTSIRDLTVHTENHLNDLVIGTYGRGFWVLDDIAPLREIAARAKEIGSSLAYLYPPAEAIRARKNSNWDQPISIEVPHVPNVPYGATIDYYLSREPSGPIKLEVFDAKGNPVRTITSELPPKIEGALYPDYWLATPESRALSTHAGLNRVYWDLLYYDPPSFSHDLENQMNNVEGTTTPGPHGPQVIPGSYTLRLTVDGQTYTRTLTVVNDPRVGESREVHAELEAQNKLSLLSTKGMEQSYAGHVEASAVRDQIAVLLKGSVPDDVATQAKALDASLAKISGVVQTGFGGSGPRRDGAPEAGALQPFTELNNAFSVLVSMVQVGLDMTPTSAQNATWESDCSNYNKTVAAWKDAQKPIADLNAALAKNNLPAIKVDPSKVTEATCSLSAAPPKKARK
jgi:photosystem II stability/assembly factor-like uncharacterized protein